MNLRPIITALALAATTSSWAWNMAGHDVIAAVAERHLSAKSAATIDALLGGDSMVKWAYWLENASFSPEYSYMLPWHYVYTDNPAAYDEVRVAASGDIVTALKAQRQILADDNRPIQERSLALKVIIHLMGDLHQPLHCGRRSDYGGSRTYLYYFGSNTSLRYMWDTSIVETAHDWTYTEWTRHIDDLSGACIADILEGDITDWAMCSMQYAHDIYEAFPAGKNVDIDDVVAWTPFIENLFAMGGIRLAYVLNCALDPDHDGVEQVSTDHSPCTGDVYSIDGRLLLRHTDIESASRQLPPGIYIIDHTKFAIN